MATSTGSSLMNKFRQAPVKLKKKYVYAPIAQDEARLLLVHSQLESGEDPSCVRVSLCVVKMQELGVGLPFEALSYHWGTDQDTIPIYIQNEGTDKHSRDFVAGLAPEEIRQLNEVWERLRRNRLYIRRNLYQALLHLRRPTTHLFLWIDAICINQDDLEEKKQQIAQMNRVYEKATRVLIWLGTSNPRKEKAMAFVKEVVNMKKLKQLVKDNEYIDHWSCLVELMTQPWFSRRWVIQELALAQAARVHCGNVQVPWDDLRDAISIFGRYIEDIRPLFQQSKEHGNDYHALGDIDTMQAKILIDKINNIFRRNRLGDAFEPVHGLEYLVSTLSNFHALDPRDTITSLRNISKETTGSRSYEGDRKPPMPDYQKTKTLVEVYIDFVRWVYITTERIDLLCRKWALPEKEFRDNDNYPELSVLPSWIQVIAQKPHVHRPKLDAPITARRLDGDSFVGVPGESPYNASYSLPAQMSFGIDSKPTIHFEPEAYDDTVAGAQEKNDSVLNGVGLKPSPRHHDLSPDPGDGQGGPRSVPSPGLLFTSPLSRKRTVSHDEYALELRERRNTALQNLLNRNCTGLTIETANISMADGSELPVDGFASPDISLSEEEAEKESTKALLRQAAGGFDVSIRVRGICIGRIHSATGCITDGVIPASVVQKLKRGTNQPAPDKLWRALVAERGPDGRNPPATYHRACLSMVSEYCSPNGHINTPDLLRKGLSDIEKEYLKRVQAVIWNRVFFEIDQTKDDKGKDVLHGFGPENARKDDIVCILFGCSVPCILRRGTSRDLEHVYHTLIGECYVYGLMDGDAISSMSKEKLLKETSEFTIM